jgi:hypothetical protein
MEPTGFDHRGHYHAGLSSRVVLLSDLSGYQRTRWVSTDHRIKVPGNVGCIERLDVRTETSNSLTTEDVLNALGRYTKESNQSDQQTAAKLGINRLTLNAWLRGAEPPQRCLLARVAGFLRRVGYL